MQRKIWKRKEEVTFAEGTRPDRLKRGPVFFYELKEEANKRKKFYKRPGAKMAVFFSSNPFWRKDRRFVSRLFSNAS